PVFTGGGKLNERMAEFSVDKYNCRLIVEDDGQGFERDPFHHPSLYALRIMRERAEFKLIGLITEHV
ncbi:hypothetical protein ACFO8Q_06550, partial [Effusibacillus consociatus]